ncbi:helix-turn-helix domain-containing protein [Microbacterium flavum]|uniref:Helix-turn-helix transcriptional regulator n=1 Tax=Microbacterium flavum TaxID=415216 RepID=A0ABS5XUW1_9MICO|nr:helix-turn-helix transcriptional regulator [Microbacterium flavum]MBT8798310.1 helix-turn-helix transcriptional regulator [Microbacterium flavum]
MTEIDAPASGDIDATLRLLHHGGDVVAPHVAARLHAALQADGAAIAQVAASLSPAQRAGLSALPDPLPVVPAVRDAVADAVDALPEPDRRLLLTAAVSVDERVDVALAAAGSTMSQALASPASAHLAFAAGRLSFLDARVRVYVHAAASLGARTAAHAALAEAYRDAGDHALATWHTSLRTLEGDAALVPDLLELAERSLRAGAAEWAHAVAREAASHATDGERLRAQIVAGRAALASGLVEDAVAWPPPPAAASAPLARTAPPAHVRAVGRREGSVPGRDIARPVAPLLDTGAPADTGVAPDTAGDTAGVPADEVDSVISAVALAAWLHAERGHLADAEAMLALSARLVQSAGRANASLDEARRWCALFGVAAPSPADAAEEGTTLATPAGARETADSARIAAALHLAREDRGDAALGMLQSGVGTGLGDARPGAADLDHLRTSPLIEAHRRVAISLVLFWEGQLARARSELAEASTVAPVSLVFAGVAVALARRLDTVTDGIPLPTTVAMDATHPTPQSRPLRAGLLVDRAITAYLDGRMTESGTLLSLAADDTVAPTDAGLPLPGLDEPSVWALAGRRHDAQTAADRLASAYRGATASHRRAAAARTRVATSSPEAAPAACRAAAEIGRTLASGYDRGRTEMLIARRYATLGELGSARTHLVAASGLFEAAGASVWRNACVADLALLPAEDPVSVLTAPITIPVPRAGARPGEPARPGDPASAQPVSARRDGEDLLAAACREAWRDVLTERELEVALLVTQGLSNREAAARLFVSVRTVEVHLGRIFTKVGVSSRVPLTIHAHRLAREYEALAS